MFVQISKGQQIKRQMCLIIDPKVKRSSKFNAIVIEILTMVDDTFKQAEATTASKNIRLTGKNMKR